MAEAGRTAPAPLGRVFFVGGTGMLAEAAAKIAKRCDHLTLAARAPEGLARRLGARPLPLDWTDRPAALRALPETRFDLVISWLHRAGLWMVPHLEARCAPAAARSAFSARWRWIPRALPLSTRRPAPGSAASVWCSAAWARAG